MIKFRAWDKRENTMRDVAVLHFTKGGKVNSIEYWKTPSELKSYHVRNLILMQSTGFKDNNDTEIFEGDVINIHWFYADFDPVELGAFENEEYAERVIVKKEFGNFGFWWEEADSWVDLATLAMSARLDEESFEILGNIYENAELLKGANE
ncbi:YopX family protein [Enterococcus asini]|uniref:YopX family protein n=1 Tax=Enterococcus asini TaxID=57732 RepID=UPI0022E5D8F7|nr:YopX family protein [Enterococcus asini]